MSRFKFLIIIFTIIISLRIFGGPVEALPQIVSFSFALIIGGYILCKGAIKLNNSYILYFVYLIIALFLSSPSPIFKSWERLLYFMVIISVVSPTLENPVARYTRIITFTYLNRIFIFATLGSFIAFFLGINWMRARNDLDIEQAGHFGGLTTQSMILGPLAGISCCLFCNKYIATRKKQYLIFSLLSFITVLIAASRGALLATLGGLCILLFNQFRHKVSSYKLLFYSVLFCVVLYPLILTFGSGIIQKNQDASREGIFDSRTTKYLARISEIESNPVIGIGFATINPKGIDSFDKETGTIEPGSSLLAILSMTGVIGFILFSVMNIQAFNAVRKSENPNRNLIIGLLSFFLIHMIVEGYVFAISNPLCIYYWLLMGVAYDSKYNFKKLGNSHNFNNVL